MGTGWNIPAGPALAGWELELKPALYGTGFTVSLQAEGTLLSSGLQCCSPPCCCGWCELQGVTEVCEVVTLRKALMHVTFFCFQEAEALAKQQA